MNERLAERARHAVYGSVIVLAVVIALDETATETGEVIGSIVGVAVATMLAELYADYLRNTIRRGRHLTSAERGRAYRDAALGFGAAILPVAFFVLAAFDVIDLMAAFDLAVWTGVGIVGFYAVVANRVAGLSVARSLAVGLAFTLLGAAVVVIKIIL